jgi:cytochrome P450 family 26 subfamily A
MTDCQSIKSHDSISVNDNNVSYSCDREGDMKYDYLTFGTGARKCIGQEFAKLVLKIFTAELAANYDWHLKDLQPAINSAPVPFPADDLPLTLKHRPTQHLMNITRPGIKSSGF